MTAFRLLSLFVLGGILGALVAVAFGDRGGARPADPEDRNPTTANLLEGLARELKGSETRSVSGTVTTLDGAPLAGVEVRPVFADAGEAGGGDGEELAASIAQAVLEFEQARAEAPRAVTGTDGRYVLAGLLRIPVGVFASKPGFRVRRAMGGEALPSVSGAGVDFQAEAEAGGGPGLVVLMPDGSVAIDADLHWADLHWADLRWTDPSGLERSARWEADRPWASAGLVPGMTRILAVRGPWLRSDPVTLPAGGSGGAPVVLRLAVVPGIRGRAVYPSQEILGNAVVRCVAVPAGAERPEGRRLPDAAPAVWLRSEEPGFGFSDLAPGDYELVVELPDCPAFEPTVVRTTVVAGVQHLDLPVPGPSAFQAAVLRVHAPDGSAPAAFELEAAVLLNPEPGTGSPGRGGPRPVPAGSVEASPALRQLLRRRDGGRLLVLSEAAAAVLAGKLAGRVLVRVRSPGLGSIEAEFAHGERPELEVRFQAPATLEVEAAVPELAGPLVWSLQRTDSPEGLERVGFDPRGPSIFQPLQPGEYLLRLALVLGTATDHEFLAVHEQALRLEAGAARIALPAVGLHPVVLSIDPGAVAEEGLSVWLELDGGKWVRWYESRERSDRYELGGLPAGRYVIGVQGTGSEMGFEVPLHGDLRWEPRPKTAGEGGGEGQQGKPEGMRRGD